MRHTLPNAMYPSTMPCTKSRERDLPPFPRGNFTSDWIERVLEDAGPRGACETLSYYVSRQNANVQYTL